MLGDHLSRKTQLGAPTEFARGLVAARPVRAHSIGIKPPNNGKRQQKKAAPLVKGVLPEYVCRSSSPRLTTRWRLWRRLTDPGDQAARRSTAPKLAGSDQAKPRAVRMPVNGFGITPLLIMLKP